MTLVSEIVIEAYRESNLRAVGQSLTTAQEAEGLKLLNNVLLAVIGQEIGQELLDYNIGGEWEDWIWEYIPPNIRLVFNAASARTLQLHPKPYDGQRVAVTDPAGNLAAANVTLNGNGRTVEGTATLVLSTNGLDAQWLYRADLGNWMRITGLTGADPMPFPQEFDDYFSLLLSMRLNPRHGREMTQTSASWFQSMTQRIQARYRRPRDQQDWGSLGLLNQSEFVINSQFPHWRGF